MGIFKNTSVALTVGLIELSAAARAISEATFQTFVAFAAGTVIYLLLALTVYGGMLAVERPTAVPSTTSEGAALGRWRDRVRILISTKVSP